MWKKVIPDWEDQLLDPEGSNPGDKIDYSGVVRFRFWRFGKWVEVLVDDLIPTFQNNDDKTELVFSHSTSHCEFWGSLLEKAYSKLHGCYAVLDGGNLSDALVDFTSGVSEVIDLEAKLAVLRSAESDEKKALFRTMTNEIEDHALMCAAIKASTSEEIEERTDLGLVKGHAYGITAVKKIPLGESNLKTLFKGREKLALIRLQNPWGQKEWSGPFSDTSPEWANISEKQREKLGLTFNDDGEFWMPFDDFLTHFSELSICRLINTSIFSLSKTWKETQFFGSWKATSASSTENGVEEGASFKLDLRSRAGGCLNHPETFLNNPQYRFDIPYTDDPEDSKLEIIVQLSQKDARSTLLSDQRQNLVIGFHIMKIEANRRYRVHQVVSGSDVATSDYIKTKHIFLRCRLPRHSGGRFVIVPTTFKPGESTDFLLRIFTEASANIKELNEDSPRLPWYKKCISSPPSMITRIKIKGATKLENNQVIGKADPYCYIKCEGETTKSHAIINSLNPSWDFTSIFYRTDISKPITIQIWNSNLVVDSFMGQAFLLAPPEDGHDPSGNRTTIHTLNLVGKKKSGEHETLPGQIKVEYESYENLLSI